MRSKVWPVILSGGSGTRLWPVSRTKMPKQMVKLLDENSLFEATINRINNDKLYEPPLIISNNEHRFLIAEQLRKCRIQATSILLEPEGRNTAPAIAMAAARIAEFDENSILLILPSDHLINYEDAFHKIVAKGAKAAADGFIITFGITPNKPETGYGYIQKGDQIDAHLGISKVNAFTEKPNIQLAKDFIKSGDYSWNSGMFMASAKTIIKELNNFEPEMLKHCQDAITNRQQDLDFERPEPTAFNACKNISIDYAVMEKTDNAAVISANLGWSDLGSWSSLWETMDKDVCGNATKGDVVHNGVNNSLLWSEHQTIAALGLENIAVIATKDAVLVSSLDKVQKIRELIGQLKSEHETKLDFHTVVHRPWGTYESIGNGPRFQTKHIVVKPGEILSLQRHKYRAEHWVVVEGVARVTCGDKVSDLKENESTYIPIGVIHRLENTTDSPVHIIEIQTGSYLGEDDIERFEDTYNRC